jgi:hypothetical protein
MVVHRADPDSLRRRRREATAAAARRGSVVGVPANASRALADDVKAAGCAVRFLEIDELGTPLPDGVCEVVWVQAPLGVHGPLDRLGGRTVLVTSEDSTAIATAATVAHLGHDPASAAAQRERCQEVAAGITRAAGLAVVAMPPGDGVVPGAVVVVLPAACDASTFIAYGAAEQTGMVQVAARRPMHPVARRDLDADAWRRCVDRLDRLIAGPVGPAFTEEEIGHAVLGIVKAAEYSGWRWWLDPVHAVAYATEMTRRYGADHEAYRPAFAC